MAAKKTKKRKSRKNTADKKSPLWVRDLVNIIIGVVGTLLVVFLVQAHMDRKEVKKVSEKYFDALNKNLSDFSIFAERYLSITENKQDIFTALQGVDISQPICAMDTYASINKDLYKLKPHIIKSMLDYYHGLRNVELLRKCIVEQQNNPQEIDKILIREFLRTVYDGSQLIPTLLFELKDSGEINSP